MDDKYKEIRNRYQDVVCGVTDYQMFRDIQSLLRYIDGLHRNMVEQAASDAVRAALAALNEGAERTVH